MFHHLNHRRFLQPNGSRCTYTEMVCLWELEFSNNGICQMKGPVIDSVLLGISPREPPQRREQARLRLGRLLLSYL